MIDRPLGIYHLYYAPHDAPGGICLAFADAIDGPWTEYEKNPIITRQWAPHYDVSHVLEPSRHLDGIGLEVLSLFSRRK